MDNTIQLVYYYFIEPENWLGGKTTDRRINQAARGNSWNRRCIEVFFEDFANSKNIKRYLYMRDNSSPLDKSIRKQFWSSRQ